VVAIVNFAPRKMGPETSEVLVLGVPTPSGDGVIPLTVDQPADLGAAVF
jgi:tRNA-binding protein